MSVLLALLLQQAREVPAPGGAPVEIRVPVASDARHPAAVVSFPEESLEALVAGWAETDLSVERRRENLFLKLLRPAQGDLHVVGGSGALYRLAVRPAEGAPYDGLVRILPAPRTESRGPEILDLVRAMRLGRKPPEGRVWRSDAAAWASDGLDARVILVYETWPHRGFVVRVENRSSEAKHLDPARFVGPDLLLSACREHALEPGASTLVYLVFGRRP